MKSHYLIKGAMTGLVCVSFAIILCALSSSATAATAEKKPTAEKKTAAGEATGEGHLTITRSPKLGSSTMISVLVDGKKAGSIIAGSRYNGPIPAGKHTLSVRFEPLSTADKAASLELNVVPGQTYSFSATIKSGAIALQTNR